MITPNGTRAVATVLTATALAGLLAIPGTARAARCRHPGHRFDDVSIGDRYRWHSPGGHLHHVRHPRWRGRLPAGGRAGQPWPASDGFARHPVAYAPSLTRRAGTSTDSWSHPPQVASWWPSAPEALTVTNADGSVPSAQASAPAPAGQAASAQTGGGCTVCRVANDALPWLALIVDPASVWGVITSVLSAVGGAILAFLGLDRLAVARWRVSGGATATASCR